MKARPRFQELLLVLIPVVVALSQLYFSNFSDLTRWKGGGFGMYTDPHPNLSRFVWLEGTGDTSQVALRLFPLDTRICVECQDDPLLKRRLWRLEDQGERIRNFPGMANLAQLDRRLHRLLEEHGEEPDIAALFPKGDFRLHVVEIGLSADYEHIEALTISDEDLCAH